MYIQVCDRCGRQTNNKPAFLLPTTKEQGSYNIGGQWFGEPIVLCSNCIIDFGKFRVEHEHFNIQCTKEDNFDGKERYQI